MKYQSFIKVTLLVLIFIGVSCGSNEKPQAIVDENTEVVDFTLEKDTTMVKVLALPVYIDSTQYIYHPTKLLHAVVNDRSTVSFKGGNYYESSSIHSNSTYEFNGNYAGFAIEHVKTGAIVNLTSKEIHFSKVRVYCKLEHNPRVEFVIYLGHDLDTNKDGKLNHNDLSALFISNLDGTGFVKLSADFENFRNYTFMVENDKLYFQTVKDTNKDGIFLNDDEFRNYVVDLTKPVKESVRYDNTPGFINTNTNAK